MPFDEVASGAKEKRPVLEHLLQCARLRQFDVVIVWKLDRFGRSLRGCLDHIAELEALGIRFIAVTQGLDTDKSNPVSRFMVNILAAAAEFERELICERVRAGLAARKAKGLPLGRQRKVFRRDLVLQMKAEGKSLRQIAQEMGISKATAGRVR